MKNHGVCGYIFISFFPEYNNPFADKRWNNNFYIKRPTVSCQQPKGTHIAESNEGVLINISSREMSGENDTLQTPA